MKKKRNILCSLQTVLFVALLLIGPELLAQNVTDVRNVKKTFVTKGETTLEVENKYGTILIVPWKKDSVQISVDMFFEAKTNAKLRRLKEDVNIVFRGSSNYLIAKTEIGEGGGRIASEIRALSNTLNTNAALEVNYTVYVPTDVNLVLSNKFGDIYIDDTYGDINISLSNGVLKANRFFGNSDIELIFARGEIREMANTSLYLSYADLEVDNVAQLDLISKSSELRIDTVGVMKISSRRDKIYLKEVEYLYGSTSFSDVIITDFIREADCDMKYGKLEIDRVFPDFSRINISSDYTDVSLYFAKACSYDLNIEHSDKAILMLPSGEKVNMSSIGEERFLVEGIIGNSDAKSEVRINAEHKCYIKLSRR